MRFLKNARKDDIIIVVPAELADPEAHKRALTLPRHGDPAAHPCPIEGCRISVEEHHRIAYGYMQEIKVLRRKLEAKNEPR